MLYIALQRRTNYRPPTKLREGNVFRGFLSVHRERGVRMSLPVIVTDVTYEVKDEYRVGHKTKKDKRQAVIIQISSPGDHI